MRGDFASRRDFPVSAASVSVRSENDVGNSDTFQSSSAPRCVWREKLLDSDMSSTYPYQMTALCQ